MIHPVSVSADRRTTREPATAQISEVLLYLEQTLEEAARAHSTIAEAGDEPKAKCALADAIRDLARVHHRLMQDTYFGAPTGVSDDSDRGSGLPQA